MKYNNLLSFYHTPSGAEFDKMRAPSGENSGNAAAPQTRKDPFGSAPFSAQEKQC